MIRIRVGSVLRGADGRRFVVRNIRKATTTLRAADGSCLILRKAEPHGGFAAIAHFEPAPEPLPFKRRKRRHRLNEKHFPDWSP
jgi:hypothetical protein